MKLKYKLEYYWSFVLRVLPIQRCANCQKLFWAGFPYPFFVKEVQIVDGKIDMKKYRWRLRWFLPWYVEECSFKCYHDFED